MEKGFDLFIEKATKIYGDRFIYKKESYTRLRDDIEFYDTITKKTFKQRGMNHLKSLPRELRKIEHNSETKYDETFRENYIKSKFQTNQFTLIKEEGYTSLYQIKCSIHGEQVRSFRQLKEAKHFCSKCGVESISLQNKITTDAFVQSIKNFYPFCDFKDSHYISATEPLRVYDLDYGFYEIEPYILKKGPKKGAHPQRRAEYYQECRKKAFYKKVKKFHPTYIWLDDYTSIQEKVSFICPVHGFKQQSAHSLSKGHGCEECSYELRAENLRLPPKEFLKRLKTKRNPDKLSFEKVNYVNLKSNIILKCPIHGFFEKRADKALESLICPYCSLTRVSSYEKELFDFLVQDCKIPQEEIQLNKFYDFLNGKQLDLYVSSYNLAIEFNGSIYHHSSDCDNSFLNSRKLSKNYHEFKFKACEKVNINLIHIFQFENLIKWKRKLKLYFENPEKYEISFKNNKRTVDSLEYYGQSYLKLKVQLC